MIDYQNAPITNEQVDRWIEAAVLAEREACAKVCEEVNMYTQHQSKEAYSCAYACAAAIRARGNG